MKPIAAIPFRLTGTIAVRHRTGKTDISKPRVFTYEQTLKYEIAREALNSRIAALSAQIGREESKSRPDRQLIERLEDEIIEIGSQRAKLDVTDEAALDRVIETLKKQPE